jgi:hypothetical protein
MYLTTVLTFFVRTFDIIRLSFVLQLSSRRVELVVINLQHFCDVCANYVSDEKRCLRRSVLKVTVELLHQISNPPSELLASKR